LLLRTYSLGRLLIHADDLFGRHNFDIAKKVDRWMGAHFGTDGILLADEQDMNIVAARSQDRAFDFRLRSAIRAHGVHGYHGFHCAIGGPRFPWSGAFYSNPNQFRLVRADWLASGNLPANRGSTPRR